MRKWLERLSEAAALLRAQDGKHITAQEKRIEALERQLKQSERLRDVYLHEYLGAARANLVSRLERRLGKAKKANAVLHRENRELRGLLKMTEDMLIRSVADGMKSLSEFPDVARVLNEKRRELHQPSVEPSDSEGDLSAALSANLSAEQPSRSWDGMSPLAASPAAEQEERAEATRLVLAYGQAVWKYARNDVGRLGWEDFPERDAMRVAREALVSRLLRSAPSGTRQRGMSEAEAERLAMLVTDMLTNGAEHPVPTAHEFARQIVSVVRAALRAVPSESQQEPVAWTDKTQLEKVRNGYGGLMWDRTYERQGDGSDVPLYAGSPVPADQEPRP